MTWICPGRDRPKGRARRCGGGSAATMAASRGDASRVAERPAARPPSIHHTDASKAPIRLFGRVLDNILGWLLGILERFGRVWEAFVRPRNVFLHLKTRHRQIFGRQEPSEAPKHRRQNSPRRCFSFGSVLLNVQQSLKPQSFSAILSGSPLWLSFSGFLSDNFSPRASSTIRCIP